MRFAYPPGMNARRFVPVVLAAVALAPPVALADSAGDQQYTDPLATTTTPAPHTAHTNTTSAASTSSTPPATVAPATSSDPAGTATTASADPAGTKRLPYTGLDLPLLAACGGLLLLAGFGLRRLVRWA